MKFPKTNVNHIPKARRREAAGVLRKALALLPDKLYTCIAVKAVQPQEAGLNHKIWALYIGRSIAPYSSITGWLRNNNLMGEACPESKKLADAIPSNPNQPPSPYQGLMWRAHGKMFAKEQLAYRTAWMHHMIEELDPSQKETGMTKEEFIDMVVTNHSSGQWLNGTFTVEGKKLGIKAYGKWVQVLHAGTCKDGSASGIKTVKAFKEAVTGMVDFGLQVAHDA